MTHLRRALASLLVGLLLTAPARAEPFSNFNLKGLGPSGAQVAAVLIPAGILIGVGIYFLARHPRVTGCVIPGAGGLRLQTDASSPRSYALTGRTADLTPNQRVKISGRRGGRIAAAQHGGADRTFAVESLKRTYGPCTLNQSAP